MGQRKYLRFPMSTHTKNWLQLYVDAMMEKDPFKRLNLVRELNNLPKVDDSGETSKGRRVKASKKSKSVRRR